MQITGFLTFLCFVLFAIPAHAFVRQPVTGANGMVVTSQKIASDVGIDILRQGGNAIDAAVAVGYALAVVNPCCGNLGGGGFATIRLADGKDFFLNFREKAPGAATENMFLDASGEVIKGASLEGYRAVAIPGTVLGLETLREKYGTLSRGALMAPAIRLAEEGFVLSDGDAAILANATEKFAAQLNVAAIFLNAGKPWHAGETLIQTDLAQTLRLIEKQGPDAFYKGSIADALVAASIANGGILVKDDFEKYTVSELAPVKCTYRGYELTSAPPPSSGGVTICLILNILEAYPIVELGYQSAEVMRLMIEAMRHAYVDRNFLLGDPDFVTNPLERLLSKDYAMAIRSKIAPGRAANSKDITPGIEPHEGVETTHYSIVDAKGNAIAVTYTINALFGAKVIAGNTGFFLNDEMDDFTIKLGAANLFGLVQGKRNAIAPGKRPLSSMSPTIVTKDGKVFMVLGSPGGSRIITIVVQTIMNVIDHDMTIQEAVNMPRIHHQWLPDEIAAERFAISPDSAKALEAMGYAIKQQSPWGAAEAIAMELPQAPGASEASSGNDATAGQAAEARTMFGGHDDRRPAGAASAY